MIILPITSNHTNSLKLKLHPHQNNQNLVVDPRAITLDHDGYRFECSITDETLTVNRLDTNDNPRTRTCTRSDKGWIDFKLRAYDAETEKVPDFTSTTYTYMGLPDERSPFDTKIGIVHPSVKTIRSGAFKNCKKMSHCIMSDSVVKIEGQAFGGCRLLRVVKLSRCLEYIAHRAFYDCWSIDVMFLPESVSYIGRWAFQNCINMRMFRLPESLDVETLGPILRGCRSMLAGVDYEGYEDYVNVHKSLQYHHDESKLLFEVCQNTAISAQMITKHVEMNGLDDDDDDDDDDVPHKSSYDRHNLTPLHILALNPHACAGAIIAGFESNPSAVFSQDDRRLTPLYYLWKNNRDGAIQLVRALCIYRQRFE